MCGIVGYVGHREAMPIMLHSLAQVNYRGYDSFGVAALDEEGIKTFKDVGSVEEHGNSGPNLRGAVGIGHTRWATVGSVSKVNAHPHSDCSGDIAIVHNGEIENFYELRQQLKERGHFFRSDTDSEVIAHLIESYGGSDIVQATEMAIKDLKGSFAVAILHRPSRKVVVIKQESPLVIGLGEGETFLASDIPGLLSYTHEVIFLEDGDLGLIGEGSYQIWNQGREVNRAIHQVNWNSEQMDKSGYAHYMLKEIHEQPRAIRDTMAAYLGAADGSLSYENLIPVKNPSSVLLLGCGTSYHAALMGELLFSPLLSAPVAARVASEFRNNHRQTPPGLSIALSQSGETADTISALRRIKGEGHSSLAITNVMGSSITRAAESTLYTYAGPEVAVASTKTFVSQLVVLYLMRSALAICESETETDLKNLRSLPAKLQQILANTDEIKQVGQALAQYDHMFLIAKGMDVPVALEGALKFKEVAYLHTEGYAAGELKHGPFALLDERAPVLAIVPDNKDRTRVITAMKEVKVRKSPVIAIVDQESEDIAELSNLVIKMPPADPLISPILHTVVLQCLSYYCALERGCPIDRPRNLAKSVTVA